jgi:hypothetical protein
LKKKLQKTDREPGKPEEKPQENKRKSEKPAKGKKNRGKTPCPRYMGWPKNKRRIGIAVNRIQQHRAKIYVDSV